MKTSVLRTGTTGQIMQMFMECQGSIWMNILDFEGNMFQFLLRVAQNVSWLSV